MPEPIPNAYQEVLDHLAKVIDNPQHGDRFKLKVLRRPNPSAQPQWLAHFTDATLSMVVNAESWLAPFAGGGLYILHVFDGEGRRQHAVLTPAEIVGAPRPPDPRITKTSTWLGPTLIDSPPMTSGNGAVALSPIHTLAGEPSTGAPPRSVAEAGLSGLFDTSKRLDEEYRRKEADLAERERRMVEERSRNEMEALRRANEEIRRESAERLRALEARLEAPKAPGPDIGAIVTGILSGVAPLVAAWVSSAAEDRRQRLELERARLDADLRKAEEAAKPKPLIDPQILEMLNRQAQRAEESAKQFGELMRAQADSSRLNLEAQGTAQRSMLQTIAQVMEIQAKLPGGKEEKGADWSKIVPAALQGLAQIARMQQGPPGAPGARPGAPGAPIPTPALPEAAGAPPAATVVPIVRSAALDAVEKLVKDKAPPSDVAARLKVALQDPDGLKEIEASGGLVNVIDARLAEWGAREENVPYAVALVKALQEEKILA